MLRAWRWATVAAFAGGAVLAAQLAVIGPAQAAAPAITIAATSKLKPVTGDVMVVYRGGAYGSAKIHGTITGAAAGEAAILYAQQFPYNKPAVPVGSITLKAATATYSFPVTPALATRYAVRLFASPATGPVATSPAQNLYVLAYQHVTGGQKCSRPVCHETFHFYTIVPTSALSVEMSKHFYPYVGLTLGSAKIPPPPKWLYLDGGHARVPRVRRISASEFENTLTVSFTIGNHSYYWDWATCTRDAVRTDGLGLPGSHGCGASRVLRTVAYLG